MVVREHVVSLRLGESGNTRLNAAVQEFNRRNPHWPTTRSELAAALLQISVYLPLAETIDAVIEMRAIEQGQRDGTKL